MTLNKYAIFIATFVTGCFSWYTYYCPEEFHCANVYRGPFAVPFCVYYCCVGPVWLSGLYGDGTPCWNWNTPFLHGLTGRCRKGTCLPPQEVPATTKRPPLQPTTTRMPSRCDGYYTGLGYATNCTYTCLSPRKEKKNWQYRDGTPCINATGTTPLGKPGVCNGGTCFKPEHMPSGYTTGRLYHSVYQQCPEKSHADQITTVADCNYYCQINGDWFYGRYMLNARCHNLTYGGYCCEGKCNKLPWCQDESKIPTNNFWPIYA
ncbi:uncharacterized protein LOC144142092 isoform X2 [Haemaphysalis longicornis]